ncbi:hypothetical protein QTP88_029180 [Uroleucon formosanum]
MDSIIQWNINSLHKHNTDIHRAKVLIQPIAFCFQETNLRPNTIFPIKGYNSFYKNRQTFLRASGGVAIFVNNIIESTEIHVQSPLEVVAVSIRLKTPLCICNIYLPDSTDLSLNDLNDIIKQLPKPFLFLGDFNCRNQSWGSNHTDSRGKTFEKFLENDQITLLNSGEYTRHNSAHNSFSAIDLTISNSAFAPKTEWKVLTEYSTSDHWPIAIKILNELPKIHPLPRWRLKNPNWNLYTTNQIQINLIIEQFCNIILDTANKTIGRTNSQLKRKSVPWWNKDCNDAIKTYIKALNRFKKTKLANDHINLKKARAQARFITKKSKTESWQKYTSSINANTSPTEMWNKIKSIKGINHQLLPPNLLFNDDTLSLPSDIAEAFAQQFKKNSDCSNYDPEFIKFKNTVEDNLKKELEINFHEEDNHLNMPFSRNELYTALSGYLEKAYDMVWRNRVLKIIQNSGINGKMFLFLQNFLKNRKTQVRALSELSKIHQTENGLPQGSVISVTMFLSAINDIFKNISKPTKHLLFADDCHIYCSGQNTKTTVDILQDALNILQDWSHKTGFKFSAVTDMVVMLLETPFRRWHSDNKNDLLKVGKPIPIFSALAPDKKLSKVFCRSFNPNLYQQHSWLCGSHYIQKLFCWPCLLLGKMKSVWNTVGYYDLKNLSRDIQIHQTSKEHIHNHLGLKNLEKNYFSILDVVNEHGNLFKKNYNENVRLNCLFMEHLIDLVLFLGKQELAFRGHDENSDLLNKGNFRELFDMHIIRCSQEIQNHYNSIKNIFSGMSKSIQNDLISCISEFLINQIKNEIKQYKFYSIQIDDTTDISQKTQCSIIIRYVTDKSELVERFLGFHNVSEDRTAQGLFNLVNSVLHEFDIENKLVGQCYDGACVMSGHLTGLQASVKEVAPNALFTHCLAHRLNLVLQHGCSINAKCRIFFANLTGIAAYFHNSTSRTNFVDTIVEKRIPQFVQTRWSSRSKILHTIVNEWSGFINVFDCISKDPKSSSESICGAIGHFKNLKTFEFAFLALVFNDIFIYTDNLFNILQNKSFDVEFCLRKINIIYDLINKKRNEPEFLKLFNQAVTLTKPPKATRNESNNQSNFKILFYEIIDNILMQLNTRFQDTNKLLFLQLADVTKFKEYSCTFPVNALNNLKSTYPNIFYNINTLKVELEVLYSDVKYQNLLHIYDMVKIIEQDALKDILPEAYKLFILILTIPSTSVSNERSFSCLKRIKTCSRNSISQVRLSSLSILSIEKSLINQLKKTESFYDDIINMYSSQKDRV